MVGWATYFCLGRVRQVEPRRLQGSPAAERRIRPLLRQYHIVRRLHGLARAVEQPRSDLRPGA